MPGRAFVAGILFGLAFALPAHACLWDYDTIVEEQRGLPSIEDAILGRYEVHTREYYQKRRDRLNAKAKQSPLAESEYDDLAVAHERLGEYERAIALMREKAAKWPGRYTTAANLGTFLVHSGRLEEGLEQLKEAIRINPEAHFGREKYQVRAIEFVLATRKDPKYGERNTILGPTMEVAFGFDLSQGDAHLPMRMASDLLLRFPDSDEGVYPAIVGMLKLGGNPREGWHEFYYALGELLSVGGWHTVYYGKDELPNAERLAWFAFQRAREAGSPRVEAIRNYQEAVGRWARSEIAADALPQQYDAARQRANAWVEAYQTFERDLLKADREPTDQVLFEPFYAQHGHPARLVYVRRTEWFDLERYFRAGSLTPWVAMLVVAIVLLYLRDRRRAKA